MPPALVDALDLVVARHAAGALPGDRRAAGMGAGTELAQLRPYEVGDDVRQIDAAATARTGEPHVRLHVPERTLTTWIVLDVSPSMAFGTAQRLKADVAEGVALVLGGLAVRRAGRVAHGHLRRRAPRACCPRAARGRAWSRCGASLAEGVGARRRRRAPRAGRRAGPRRASVARQPGFVAVISDFRDQHDWTRPLGALRGAPLGAGRRGRRPARGASCPPSGAWPSSTPRPASASRSTPRARACASASPRSRASAARRSRASCAACTSTTSRCRTERDWLLDLGRRLR